MTSLEAILSANLTRVRERIARAAEACGRDPGAITLIAVTKYVDLDLARALLQLGVCDLGENRWQVAQPKVEALREGLTWHFIGSIQTNKLTKLLPAFSVFHGVDGARVAQAMQTRIPQGESRAIFVQVNVSGAAGKHGIAPSELAETVTELARCDRLRPLGLMTMAQEGADYETLRATFDRLRTLGADLPARDARYPAPPALSMGMSGDFEIAIACGATHLRLGSVLYRGLPGFD